MKRKVTVFRVERDPRFTPLVPVNQSLFDSERNKSWKFDGSRDHHQEWVELEMQPGATDLRPDIWEVVPGVFAMENKAAYELCSSTEETQEGYMHYLACEKRKLAVINSTHCVDCLDQSSCIVSTGDVASGTSYIFDGNRLDISLFKIPETRERELYALSGLDPENDFVTLVEKHRFTGVQFVELWSGDSFMEV